MKLATKLNANLIQGAGSALVVASFFQPRHSPLEDTLSYLGTVLIWAGLAVHSYVWGRARGYGEGRIAGAARETRTYFGALGNHKPEDPALWEALSESRDAEPTEGAMWGTDYWGDILSEPSEQQARALAKASDSKVYTRQPHCEWELVSA